MIKKENEQEIIEAKEDIKKFYAKMDQNKAKIIASVKSVSQSGMQRKISFIGVYVDDKEGKIYRINLTYYISLLCNYSIDRNIYALIVRGCGMDMIFGCLYSLACVLGIKDYNKYTIYDTI